MESLEDIETPLEPVEYLARSPSRVGVLDAIQENPRTRNELKEMTDVSRVTLSRILSSFEDRGWIERTNGRYETTPEGAFVATRMDRRQGHSTQRTRPSGRGRNLTITRTREHRRVSKLNVGRGPTVHESRGRCR